MADKHTQNSKKVSDSTYDVKKIEADKLKRDAELIAMNHVFLQIIPLPWSKAFAKKIRFLSQYISHFFPQLKQDLRKAGYTIETDEYIGIGLCSYIFLGLFAAFGLWYVFYIEGIESARAIVAALGIGFLITLIFVYLSIKHPAGIAQKRSVDIEKYLLYALRDISLHISSGGTVYDAIKEASIANYGEASKELSYVSRKIHMGLPIRKVLHERLALVESEFMKKTYWQIINSVEVGTDLRESLKSIIRELDAKQKAHIENYARELSLWSLVYMMFAVAIPTIGLTMMVILASFAGIGLNESSFIAFIVLSFILQIGLIVFVKSRRPVVEF